MYFILDEFPFMDLFVAAITDLSFRNEHVVNLIFCTVHRPKVHSSTVLASLLLVKMVRSCCGKSP